MTRVWLMIEAAVLTLPATLFLAAGMPIAVQAVSVVYAMSASLHAAFQAVLACVPYLCALFAWCQVWLQVLQLARGGRLELDGAFWFTVMAGCIATLDFLLVQPQWLSLLVCLPVWLLVLHLTMLGVRPQIQQGPELA